MEIGVETLSAFPLENSYTSFLPKDAITLQAVWRSLKSLNLKNAALLVDILLSNHCYCEEVLYLSAYLNYSMGRVRVAHSTLLMGVRQKRSKFLLAKCCMELKMYSEGISSLNEILEDATEDSSSYEVDRAEAYNLLGEIHMQCGNYESAADAFKSALKENSFLLTALQNYCFTVKEIDKKLSSVMFNQDTVFNSIKDGAELNFGYLNKVIACHDSESILSPFQGYMLTDPSVFSYTLLKALNIVNSGVNTNKCFVEADSYLKSVALATKNIGDRLRRLSDAYCDVVEHRCTQAIEKYKDMSSSGYSSPWLSAQIAYCYYEKTDYSQAITYFCEARSASKSIISKMDVYSSCLWHEGSESDLMHLCHELKLYNPSAPETWCAVGNLKSLRNDSAGALEAFKYATLLDPYHSYAYLLLGLEYMNSNDFENSARAQMRAICINRRQYNSCIALGDLCTRTGKLSHALLYYKRAYYIKPNCPVANYRLGRFYVKDDPSMALMHYRRAYELNKKNLAYYYGCVISLIAMKEYDSALNELNIIQDSFPVEPVTYMLLGIVYEKKNDKQNALLNLTKAQDMKDTPKNILKSLIDNIFSKDPKSAEFNITSIL